LVRIRVTPRVGCITPWFAGEENAQLAARVEHLKSEKDLQLIQMRSEISTFKQVRSELRRPT
jgi:hypothetical protein